MLLHVEARFPYELSQPLNASVTLWEATAPVKLPTKHCLPPMGELDFQIFKSGVSLAPKLPPTLHINTQKPIPSCSKASRGLSVLLWLTGICTGIAISPSPSLRQFSDRYAIRAGRNLPDKEFRSLMLILLYVAIEIRLYLIDFSTLTYSR